MANCLVLSSKGCVTSQDEKQAKKRYYLREIKRVMQEAGKAGLFSVH